MTGDDADTTEGSVPPTLPVDPLDGPTQVDPSTASRNASADTGQRGVLGRHQLGDTLGAGGMGLVYAAVDPDLGRTVAAKVVRGAASESLRRKLVREARVTGQLEHPNIVPVHQLGEDAGGQLYFTMKRVEGDDLGAMLKQQADPLERATLHANLQRFGKICDGMALAHHRGVVHRDLKPANVMIGRFGEVLVMDWGLARVLGQPDGDPIQPGDAAQTAAGTVMGTPAYMSPEQARGEPVEASSDIHALGAILYTLLAHRAPFGGDTPWVVIDRVARGERTPLPADVPWELTAVIDKAMAPDPADRYADAMALRADVDAYLAGRLLGAADYRPWQRLGKLVARHRAAAIVLLLGLAGVAAMAGTQRWRRARELDGERARAAHLIDERAAEVERLVRDAAARAKTRSAGNPPPAEPLTDGELRQEVLRDQLAAVGRLDRVLAERPGDTDARALRIQAGRAIGQLALIGGDYTLARWSVEQLGLHGLDDEAISAWQAQVEARRTRHLDEQAARVTAILADLAAGLARPGRDRTAPTAQEYLRELVGYRHPRTVAQLAAAIAPLTARARAQRDRVRWTQRDRDLAAVVCQALGELRLAQAVAPLADWLAALHDSRLILVAGRALCSTRLAAANAPLMALRRRLPLNSEVWTRIAIRLNQIPEAGAAATSASELIDRAHQRIERGDLPGALADSERAIVLAPGEPRAWNLRGNLRLRQGRLDEALADYDRAIRIDPEVPQLYLNRAKLHGQAGRDDAAVADARRAIELAPRSAELHQFLGLQLSRMRRHAEAERSLSRALQLEPSALRYLDRAMARRGLGRRRDAIADLDRAIARDGAVGLYYRERGKNCYELGEHAKAIADLDRAIALDPGDAEAFAARGLVRVGLTQHAQALIEFDQALALDPSLPHARVGRGMVHWYQGDLVRARASFDKAVEVGPGFAWGYYRRGQLRLSQGDPAGAERDLTRALELQATLPGAHVSRGVARARLRNLSGAIEDCSAAIALQPGEAKAWVNRGLWQIQSAPERALADLRRGLQLGPLLWPGWNGLGILQVKRGQLPQALAAFRKAHELAPESQRASVAARIRRVQALLEGK